MIYAWVPFSLDLTTSATCSKKRKGKDGSYDDAAKYLEKGYAYQVADWHMNGLETSVQLATDAAASAIRACRSADAPSAQKNCPCLAAIRGAAMA